MAFFVISKLAWLLAAPSNFFILLVAFGAGLSWTPAARGGRIALTFGVLGLFIGAFTPLGNALLAPLENRFPLPNVAAMTPPDGILVLGGAMDEDMSDLRHSATLTQDGSRMTLGVALARVYPNAKLVFSGGSGHLLGARYTEADAAKSLWLSLGVPASQMRFEDRSRNTFENARFTKALLHPVTGRVWLLVTSAYHMPRAVGIFRKAGFDVVPVPTAYRTKPWPKWLAPDFEASRNLQTLDIAVHEWLGLIAYRLSGRTSALFPAP
ncbi:MAG: YdcF family protein [Hyphomicrobiales bacterium]|nr:YdcF family protein [Hyphomicrobiales bacterium]MDE2114686.1 YdcF family protein [Hyphomicrobiales bacterium]